MTINAPGGSRSPRSGQSPDNQLEQALVEHLLETVIESLTDRTGTVHHFPWTPKDKVRVGVLDVQVDPQVLPDASGSAQHHAAGPQETRPSIDNRGAIGLDFIVGDSPSEVELSLDVRFALYHPMIPPFTLTAAEAQRRSSMAADNPRRRPTIPVSPSWRRDNRHVIFTMRIPVTGDEETLSSDMLQGGDPLAADADSAVTAHYKNPRALRKLRNNQTLPVAAALRTEAEFLQALSERRDLEWQPQAPIPRITVTTMPSAVGGTAVSVSLVNAHTLEERGLQDLALYDAKVAVTVKSPGHLVPQQLRFAAEDARYAQAATVPGRGRGCVAASGDTSDTVVTQTLPIHAQYHSASRDHGADLSFSHLASDPEQILQQIAQAMRQFITTWDFSAATTSGERALLTALRDQFTSETERFELGCSLLKSDPRLRRAFIMANKAFTRAKGEKASWRLFQLVFIVTELGALAARENPADAQLRIELESVDVLWFPTGGGKTEAYLGLATVALFYDRLRGKRCGTSTWLLFPLRMLSVQQLSRISQIIHYAEEIRDSESLGGDPFSLGYLVGAGNTPNWLAYNDSNSWWPGLDSFAKWDMKKRDDRRLVSGCPACGGNKTVGLDADLKDQRLLHKCRNCGYNLPIYASDEEVTRYQASIVVSTVDKITAFARNGQLTAFNRGPRMQCPQHGWYSYAGCVVRDCQSDMARHLPPSGFRDPTPALWIQDELHLVREELGVFAAHYHTLLAELATGAGNQPSKVIAATATIEQYEDQLSQVYGRRPRMFPTGGPTLRESFYAEATDDVRRIFLGILPAGGGTAKVDLAGQLTTLLIKEIHDLMDQPAPLLRALAEKGHTVILSAARDLLFNYELALAYVNSKAHGVAIHDDIQRLSELLIRSGSDRVRSENLSGETPLGELAAIVAEVEDDSLTIPREQRLRGMTGTSVVSHGIDLDRLNLEILAGMPPSYAHYIQATARSGRTHVGLVISVFGQFNRREVSIYQSFLTTHAALDRMVEPVPVNRYASRAIERTLPGIVCSLLWDATRDPRWSSTDEISFTRKFRPWWDVNKASLAPQLSQRIERAYRCPVPDPAMRAEENKLASDAVNRWETIEQQRMQQWQSDKLSELFTSPAMSSLRDVDPPVEFSGNVRSDQIISRLQW
jgi:hypothetical protein